MITRTYPSECTIYNCDSLITTAIRDRLGDRTVLKRFRLSPTDNFSDYIDGDTSTFYIENPKVWPYNLKVGNTVCSGIDCAQVIDYHYIALDGYDLTASGMDFWLETFKLSDYEIWTAFLSVDLSPIVRTPNCITLEMEIIKAAIDLLPSIRDKMFEDGEYMSREVTDKNQSYRQSLAGGVDPYKDLLTTLQSELTRLIERNCYKRLYRGGYRLE
jgi:hypothetical protein